jgi:hypothetical protein
VRGKTALFFLNRTEKLSRIRSLERQTADDESVESDTWFESESASKRKCRKEERRTQAPDIASIARLLLLLRRKMHILRSRDQLRRHVSWTTRHAHVRRFRLQSRRMLRSSEFRDAEIDEFDVGTGDVGEEGVVGFDVAVDDLVMVQVGDSCEKRVSVSLR